jgi:subtilase family serine protease
MGTVRLNVDHSYRNNLLISVNGTAAQLQQAFFTNLVFRLRKDGSPFVTVDRELSMDFSIPILRISGLNENIALHAYGTGPKDALAGTDFRRSYAPNVPETGVGQTVALVAFDGFLENDITAYRNLFGLPNVPIKTVLLRGFDGKPSGTRFSVEVALDIEMAMSMAPGLDSIIVYEGPKEDYGDEVNAVLSAIAAPPQGTPLSRQISNSFGYNVYINTQQLMAEFAIQGQSFFSASGDSGAYVSDLEDNRDLPYTTLVGGTDLAYYCSFGECSYKGDTAWDHSGGGILTNVPIPDFQKTVNMTRNNGSNEFRNAPDVSMAASDIYFVGNTNDQRGGGTSAATPLWAGFMALVNQRAQNNGKGPVGYANPLLYSIGQTAEKYSKDFNDVIFGFGNSHTDDTSRFSPVEGYDLVTGWGTPTANLIYDLSGVPVPGSKVVTIRYHQVGACNGYKINPSPDTSGIVSAGPKAAYVIFGIESLDNSQSLTAFNFDPSKLFVQQARQEFFDDNLGLYRDILKTSATKATTINPGQNFKTKTFGALIVATTNANGAAEAINTPYFLRYKASSSDPTINLVKSDSSRTSWPLTEDCTTIVLQ